MDQTSSVLAEYREEIATFDPSVQNANALQVEQIEDNPMPRPNKYLLKCAFLASITSLILGFEIGAMSETFASIMKEQKTRDKNAETLMWYFYLSSLFGSVMAGMTADWYGRRHVIGFVGLFFFIGPFVTSINSSNASVLFGRFITQVGTGYALIVTPIYMAEISPAVFRGLFTSLPEVFISFGTIIGYIANYLFRKLPFSGWFIMCFVGAICFILLAIAVRAMPESPRWLVMQGRLYDAQGVLYRISNSEEEAAHLLAKIKQAASNAAHASTLSMWWDLFYPTRFVCHMLVCAILMQVARQACGFDTIFLYSPRILEMTGVKFLDDKFLMVIALEFVKAIFTLVASFLVDKVGRRWMLLCSLGLMIGSLVSLGVLLNYIDQGYAKYWCIASLFIYVASYSVGMGPITSVYNSELFPLRLRAKGCAIAFITNQLMSGIISWALLPLDEAIIHGNATFFFAAISCISWFLFYKIMPETRGLTLEEMSQFFGSFFRWKHVAGGIALRRSTPVRMLETQVAQTQLQLQE